MCQKPDNPRNPQPHELNNWNFIFDQPQKPKISTRKFVNSAKINLNRYWSKLEEIIQESTKIKKKNLKKLKTINQQILNNRIHPMKAKNEKQQEKEQIKSIFSKEKNVANGKYKPFLDDSLYHGVNLNPVQQTMTLPKYYDNYCFYLQELQQLNISYHHNNNAFVYRQQLNESIRRKEYKFTLADIEGKEDPNYYKGQYLEDEGYLV